MTGVNSLNDRQKEAVLHKNGPLLVIAGAGTGKTNVLTHRIARLIEDGIPPYKILAVTFTNKAAQEMRERVEKLLQSNEALRSPFGTRARPFIGTFHALGVYLLRKSGRKLGIKRNFSIKDRGDSIELTKEAVTSLGFDVKQYVPSKIHAVISKAKGNLFNATTYREEAGRRPFLNTTVRVWEVYESLLKQHNALDFDDLIQKPVFLLKEDPAERAQYEKEWSHILIDEYQDTNVAQYELIRLLGEGHQNVFAVGDHDQAIYSWRGADSKNIERFEEDFPEAKVVTLEENYRSTKIILDAANEVIRKNRNRKEKNLFTREEGGGAISLFVGEDEMSEAYQVAEEARSLIAAGISPDEIAVLYRANFQSRVLEEAFLSLRIPYRIIGTRFFERREVKDVLAFINAALNRENLGDIKRIINVPPRGIGKASIAKLFAGRLHETSREVQNKTQKFFAALDAIEDASHRMTPRDLIAFVLKITGLETHLKNEGADGIERLENIQELATIASRFNEGARAEENLEAFLNSVALASDRDAPEEEKKGVRLMTVHAAKGLEFEHVFIAGLEQGLFPHEAMRGREDSNESEKYEEERRLFYVALTRAKKGAHLSLASQRTIFGMTRSSVPSEFLGDIPQQYLELKHSLLFGGEEIIQI